MTDFQKSELIRKFPGHVFSDSSLSTVTLTYDCTCVNDLISDLTHGAITVEPFQVKTVTIRTSHVIRLSRGHSIPMEPVR